MKVGFLAFYSDYYEPVAPGLAKEKVRHAARIMELLAATPRIEIVDGGVAKTYEDCHAARAKFISGTVDCVVMVPLVAVFARFVLESLPGNVRIVVVDGEDGGVALDPDTITMAELICHSQGLASQAFGNVLMRAGERFSVVSGTAGSPAFAAELRAAVMMPSAKQLLQGRRIAQIGTIFDDMRDVVMDFERFAEVHGIEALRIPHEEVARTVDDIGEADISELETDLRNRFVVHPMPETEWRVSLATACGYLRLLDGYNFDGGAMNSHSINGLENPSIGIMCTLALSLLSERGVSLAEVGDMQTGIALFLCQVFGIPATYAELDAADHHRNVLFIANSGELDLAMARQGELPAIRSNVNFRGLNGGGAAFDAALTMGAATLICFTECSGGKWRIIALEGEILENRSPNLQLVNAQMKPSSGNAALALKQWAQAGAVHHSALAPGHLSQHLKVMCQTLDWEFVEV